MTPEERAALRRIDRQFDAIRSMPRPIPASERHRHRLEEVKRGGYLRVAGQIHRVADRSPSRGGRSRGHTLELFGLETGDTTWLDWQRDGGIAVRWTARKLELRDLGVSAADVVAMSDAERGSIALEGRRYRYVGDYALRSGSGEGEGDGNPYCYAFETQDGRFGLSIEERGDAAQGYAYEARLSERLDPEAVEVLVLWGDGGERGARQSEWL